VLTRGYLRQTLLLAPSLHLQEGDERGHLSLDSVQANEPCKFLLDLGEGTRRNLHSRLNLLEPFSCRTERAPKLRPDQAKPGKKIVDRTTSCCHRYSARRLPER
jgi:hypothetical protein